MKKLTTILLLAAITIALVFSCKKEAETPTGGNKIEIGQSTTDYLSYFTAKVSTTISATGGNEISQHGHCWGTDKEPTIENNKTTLGKLTEPKTYTSELINLTNNTTYYVCSYVTYANGTIYGSEQSIQTLKTGKPIVTTTQVNNVTLYTATLGGIVQADSGLAVTTRGVCWDTDSILTITNCLDTTIVGNGLGSFTYVITNLNEGITYYTTAYATNEEGTSYGEIIMFTTVPITLPTVTTTEITDITYASAIGGGNVTSNGNGTVTARGVCWNIISNPTLENSLGQTTDDIGTGSFTSNITVLNDDVTYYITAYATNEKGTRYGEELSFKTMDITPCDGQSYFNYHGDTYNTIEIEYQCWMRENLNYETGNSWCNNNDPAKCIVYGRLYDWATIMNGEGSSSTVPSGVQGICPDGWHLPSDEEWKILEGNTDTQYGVGDPEWDGDDSFRGYDAGKRLKATTDWSSNTGTNAVDFSALPGGFRNIDGLYGGLGESGNWWSATEYSSGYAWMRRLYSGIDGVARNNVFANENGLSVRCVRD